MTTAAPPPRVVLVEDDPSLRRFVQLALEELGIELVECTCVAEGLDALRAAPAQVVMTDLMLAGPSGLTLVEQLTADPALRSGARIIVFSSGLTPEIRQYLQAFDVWRVLSKPVGLRELERCVVEAVDAGRAQAGIEPPTAALGDARDEAWVIAHQFNGDAELYQAFRESCMAQFPRDMQAGDAARAAADLPSLRRLAHNLKSALKALGHHGLGQRFAELENLAARGDLPSTLETWDRLRSVLSSLTEE